LTSFAIGQSPVPTVEQIATGFQFVEGPLWKDSVGLLFSDIWPGIIYQWSPNDKSTKIYLKPSDSSNGLTFDKQGRLVLTQMALRRVARQESNGIITPLASTYNGKKFNSPNDVVVRSDGSIFFTDPDFNTPNGQSKELSFRGIFRISPFGTVQLLDSSFDKPNGICFSPDEKKLYVNESPQHKIFVWDVVNDSTIANKKVLYTIPMSGYADGMKTDLAGNIYCTGPTGVWVVSPSGTYLDKIATPETPTNCAWGDADRRTLFITAGTSLYRIRLAPATGVRGQGSLLPKTFESYANYPNPFNPSTEIQYGLPEATEVNLTIYDIGGQKVETIVDGYQNAGTHRYRWNASNNRGRQIASGAYLARISAWNFSKTIKLILMN
jgi:gluconolactonase